MCFAPLVTNPHTSWHGAALKHLLTAGYSQDAEALRALGWRTAPAPERTPPAAMAWPLLAAGRKLRFFGDRDAPALNRRHGPIADFVHSSRPAVIRHVQRQF